MTDIVFSFDTEDIVNIDGFDGILRTAQILKKHNIRGSFQVVGRMAQQLERYGRTDIIEELKHHEIGIHSLGHSIHPTINECTDIEDYDAAHSILSARENECVSILKRVFGVDSFNSACPPGNSVSYVAHYLYNEMGVPVYCGDMIASRSFPCPVYFCNMLCTDYDICLEAFLVVKDDNMWPLCPRSEDEIRKTIDWAAENKDLLVCYHHPSMSMYAEWWDGVNYNGENTPEDEWRTSKRVPDEAIEWYYDRFDHFVSLIKADPRFSIKTYGELAAKYSSAPRTISLKDIPCIRSALEEKFHPVTAPHSYCISDIFHACGALLRGEAEYRCRHVKGFLATPYAIERDVTVTRDEMVASAKAMQAEEWLPTEIQVGESILGPADWLRAALAVLCGEDRVTLSPGPWQIDLDQFAVLRDLDLKQKWIDTKDLMDNFLSYRSRLQSWTLRLPEGKPRVIV